MKKFYIFFIFFFILSQKLYSHDESSLLSTICSFEYKPQLSRVNFSLSKKNLISHGVVNLGIEGKFQIQVFVEIKNLSGDIENYAGQVPYRVEGGELELLFQWITIEYFESEFAWDSLKSRIGDRPQVNCYVVL